MEFKNLLFVLILGIISCSEQNQNPGQNAKNLVSKMNLQSSCTSGNTYDYQFGRCLPSCVPPGSCGQGNICNPLTLTCEPFCVNAVQCPGPGYLNHSGPNQVCVIPTGGSSGYCAATCTTTPECSTNFNNGTNFVCSRGMCVQACTARRACASSSQICDYTTGGCGIGCVPGQSNVCQNISFYATSGTTTGICSPYSATCVPQCVNGTCSSGQVCNILDTGNYCEINEINGISCIQGTNSVTVTQKSGTTPATQNICEVSCSTSSAANCQQGQTCLATTNTCGFSICTGSGCQAGLSCMSGYCVSPCNPPCTGGLTCNSSTGNCYCNSKTAPCSNNQGCISGTSCGKCTSSIQCPTNQVCDTATGQCVASCSSNANCSGITPICANQYCQACSNTNPCTPPATCQTTGHSAGSCQVTCPAGNCNPLQPGYACVAINSVETCKAICTSSSCQVNTYCDLNNLCTHGLACTNNTCQVCSSSNPCQDNNSCINSYCRAAYLGDGIPNSTGSDTCDEGDLNHSCTNNDNQCPQGFVCPVAVGSTSSASVTCIPTNRCCADTDCPTNSTCMANASCSSTNKAGYCLKPTTGFTRGNGLNGHCSADGTKICAVAVALTAPAQPSTVWNTMTNTASSISAAITTAVGLQKDTPCPNGYGVWVTNGTDSNSTSISITPTVPTGAPVSNIYGGFSGTETTIDDRLAQNLGTPLDWNSPSGTVLTGSTGNTFSITAGTVVINGFQILNSQDSAVKIASGATGILKNLRIHNNKAKTNGGGIDNLGTLQLSHSLLSLNTAPNQGGGLYNESTGTASIDSSTFWGNAANPSSPWPLCNAGGTCPGTMTCPSAGGICTGTPTCLAKGSCPAGLTCPAGGGTCTGTLSPIVALGGGIASAGTLTVQSSKFNGNYSYGNGGGIYSISTLNVYASEFAANWASNAGGGIYLAKPTTGSAVATLGNSVIGLGFIDNAAYTLGGGGIYDEGTSSNISNSNFVNNQGLYAVNNINTRAEWIGNQPGNTANQINSISDGVSYATGGSISSNSSSALMTKTNVNMCPMMAYTASMTQDCNGSQVCGIVPTTSLICNNVSGNSSCTFNAAGTVQTIEDIFGNTNTCQALAFTAQCSAPQYKDCSAASIN